MGLSEGKEIGVRRQRQDDGDNNDELGDGEYKNNSSNSNSNNINPYGRYYYIDAHEHPELSGRRSLFTENYFSLLE